MTSPTVTAVSELKPCPCCGCLAGIHAEGFCFSDGRPGWRVECEGACHLMTCYWHTEAQAVEAWNRRSALADVGERKQSVTLNDYALLRAVESRGGIFSGADVTIEWMDGHEDGNGYVIYDSEYPEEGSMMLDHGPLTEDFECIVCHVCGNQQTIANGATGTDPRGYSDCPNCTGKQPRPAAEEGLTVNDRKLIVNALMMKHIHHAEHAEKYGTQEGYQGHAPYAERCKALADSIMASSPAAHTAQVTEALNRGALCLEHFAEYILQDEDDSVVYRAHARELRRLASTAERE